MSRRALFCVTGMLRFPFLVERISRRGRPAARRDAVDEPTPASRTRTDADATDRQIIRWIGRASKYVAARSGAPQARKGRRRGALGARAEGPRSEARGDSGDDAPDDLALLHGTEGVVHLVELDRARHHVRGVEPA